MHYSASYSIHIPQCGQWTFIVVLSWSNTSRLEKIIVVLNTCTNDVFFTTTCMYMYNIFIELITVASD